MLARVPLAGRARAQLVWLGWVDQELFGKQELVRELPDLRSEAGQKR